MSNSVWDIDNGVILKLGEGRVITHAIRGFSKLSNTNIEELYGSPPIFRALKWPDTAKNVACKPDEGMHWAMLGLWEACKIPAICQVTHYINLGV
jgi:hypothetical protein